MRKTIQTLTKLLSSLLLSVVVLTFASSRPVLGVGSHAEAFERFASFRPVRVQWRQDLALAGLNFLCSNELDLPVAPPRSPFAPPLPPPPAEPEQDPAVEEEDPRDTPPAIFFGEEIESENETIYYVLDQSGSMQSYKTNASFVDPDGNQTVGNRWERAKAEAIKSIRGLSDNFRFGVLSYNCGQIYWSAGLREATAANKADAEAWIKKQYWATGMTGTGPAASIPLAIKDLRALVLLTDGEPNCGANGTAGHRAMIAQNNVSGAVINVFGIQASGPWRAFCQGVAADSGGSYYDLP